MEYKKSSFFKEFCPSISDIASHVWPFAIIYAIILIIAIVISLHFQWGWLSVLLDIMMGWSLPSIAFGCIIVGSLDINVIMEKDKTFEPLSFIWTMILVGVCITGFIYSNKYKHEYDFKCSFFLLDNNTGIYHTDKKCEYIGMTEDDINEYKMQRRSSKDYRWRCLPANKTGNYEINTTIVRGIDLWHSNYSFCRGCEDMLEDANLDYELNRYSHK